MRNILLFGAGKSATVLIEYLLQEAQKEKWNVTVADANLSLAQEKTGTSKEGKARRVDIQNKEERRKYIEEADIVISLLPPTLHYLVALDCLEFGKNLLTASYVDEQMNSLRSQIEEKKLLFLCEMGLDPGIDHMSALKMIHTIKAEGGTITSFYSHCGGLIAPESDDNPWHYKISWNPKNVVLAGKSGATFKKEGKEVHLRYEELFNDKRYVIIPELEPLCWYPNRDSISYASLYGLGSCPTFIRTTLRHPDFMYGWKNIIELKLTDETVQYETDNKTLMGFFKEHMDRNGFGEWLTQKMQQQLESTKSLLEGLMNIVTLEEEDEESGLKEMMLVNEKGNLEALDIDDLKLNAAATVADTMREANLTLKQLFFLGMDDDETHINKGKCSAADVLQFALEKKLALQEHDKDMVVMLHEIEFTKGDQRYLQKSSLIVKGEDNTQTAMAKTVGLPLGIATKLILNGAITIKGLQIPIIKEIYEPVLQELQAHGIQFTEERVQV